MPGCLWYSTTSHLLPRKNVRARWECSTPPFTLPCVNLPSHENKPHLNTLFPTSKLVKIAQVRARRSNIGTSTHRHITSRWDGAIRLRRDSLMRRVTKRSGRTSGSERISNQNQCLCSRIQQTPATSVKSSWEDHWKFGIVRAGGTGPIPIPLSTIKPVPLFSRPFGLVAHCAS